MHLSNKHLLNTFCVSQPLNVVYEILTFEALSFQLLTTSTVPLSLSNQHDLYYQGIRTGKGCIPHVAHA